MEKILKAKLYKKQLLSDAFDYNAQVIFEGEIDIEGVVEELIKDNNDLNRESILDIISKFNQKTADMIFTGHTVNTGLVTINPAIKGPFNEKKWNPLFDRLEATITQGPDLEKAISETNVELNDENNELLGLFNPEEERKIMNASKNLSKYQIPYHNTPVEPACGIAFRRWLCGS